MTTAQAWAIRAALPFLRKSEHPRIINVTSTEAHGATRFNSAYVVAKHASLGLTRAMSVELGKEGITVNCVCPGPVRTGITDAIPEKAKQTFANRRTALRRYAESEEVAHATLSLVLPAASFITGATLLVDGGDRANIGCRDSTACDAATGKAQVIPPQIISENQNDAGRAVARCPSFRVGAHLPRNLLKRPHLDALVHQQADSLERNGFSVCLAN